MLLKDMWKRGRQSDSLYFKLKIFESTFPLPFDVYLLKFPTGGDIREHTDPVSVDKRHYRVNVVLKPAKRGGEFRVHTQQDLYYKIGPFEFFRPDLCVHSMTPVVAGTKYYLSIGWLLR